MADSFKPGDVVSLKSGGPKMTVVELGQQNSKLVVRCDWFAGTEVKHGTFPPDSLQIVPEGPIIA